jgi:7-cyano-7-deazaguanine synthase
MGDGRVKAICVCSGGLDSTVSATIAKRNGYDLYLLHINYGHRSESREIDAVKEISALLDAKELKFVNLDFLRDFGGSSLLDESIQIPTGTEIDLDDEKTPSTWVPCRNLIFLSIVSAYAEIIDADRIFVGFNAEEARSYPDNTPEFVRRFNYTLEKSFSSPRSTNVEAPLIDMQKKDIIQKAIEINAPIELTWSCYLGGEVHCGLCESCQRRRRAFDDAGVKDPTKYENRA